MTPQSLMQTLANQVLLEGWTVEELEEALKLLETPEVLEFTHVPVGFREFVESPYFLDSANVLYPEVLRCGEEMNNGSYEEAVLTGGIGTGKTTLALFSTAYQLYLLSCYKSPQKSFGLDPASEIVLMFQSINATLAKTVGYERFKAMIAGSPYFKEQFPFDKTIVSELRFPNRIIVKSVSGNEAGTIGQNVIGGIIDEINFMAVVEKGKKGDGGTYDQAMALYNSIKSRRKSRFMKGGKMPGLLCLVSSKRFPGQFTDKKTEEAQRELDKYGKTNIYVYDKTVWQVKPEGSFSGEWFTVFIGDEFRKPYVIESDADLANFPAEDVNLLLEVPAEYRQDFDNNLLNSLREIGGVSTLASAPFILNRNAITEALRKDYLCFGRDSVDFVQTKLQINPKKFKNPELPRFVHCDLAITGDSAGFAIGTVTGFKTMTRGDGTVELLPDIWIDAVLEITPPKNGEILFYKVREIIYAMKKLGMNIRWVSFDSFQSRDSMQLLKQAGYMVGYQSMDTSMAPYEYVKNALYDGRLSLPHHPKLVYELSSLEKDIKKRKIDHPAHASKDVSDALAGVVYGLTMRREIWAHYSIPLGQLPKSVLEQIQKAKEPKGAQENA